jgi:hypothetical protein
MNETAIVTGPAPSIRDCNALLVSAVCHLAAMIALGVLAAANAPDAGQNNLLADVADLPDALDDRSPWSDAVEMAAAATEAGAANGPMRLFDSASLATADFAPLEALVDRATVESGREGSALGDFGTANGYFEKGVSEFFGVSGYGNTFVYVVDCSGSMNDSGKFERAKYELLQSIEQLSDEQKFYVIFYSDEAQPMAGAEPVLATEDELARARYWINGVRPNGGTNPLPALLIALSLRPDAIYFLSDGLFNASSIAELRMRNRRRAGHIPIHSIAFVSRENLGLMRAIARDSGGQFRFVR